MNKTATSILVGGALLVGVGLLITPSPNNSYDCTQPIKFTITNTQGYSFTDALHLDQDKCENMTDEDIAGLEKERFDSWINIINDNEGNFSPSVGEVTDQTNEIPQ